MNAQRFVEVPHLVASTMGIGERDGDEIEATVGDQFREVPTLMFILGQESVAECDKLARVAYARTITLANRVGFNTRSHDQRYVDQRKFVLFHNHQLETVRQRFSTLRRTDGLSRAPARYCDCGGQL